MVSKKKVRLIEINMLDMKVNAWILAAFVLLLANTAFGQGHYGETPEDSAECVKNISLYSEFYKQNNYIDARPFWVKSVEICPKASKNHYIKGVTIYRWFYSKTKDKALQDKYTDTLMWVYDLRIEHFGERGFVLGRKGSDLLRYGGEDRYEEAYKILEESFKLRGNQSEAGALMSYYQVAYQLVTAKKLEKTVLLDLYEPIMNAIKPNLSEGKEGYDVAAEQVEKMFSAVASCEELIGIYQPKFESNKGNIEFLNSLTSILEKRDCTASELFLSASIELDKLQPSSTSKVSIGIALFKKDRNNEAIKYFDEAGSLAENKEEKVKAYLLSAKANFASKNNAACKASALKVLQADPSNGEAYMLIGDAYFYGSFSVGENDCEKNGGLWASLPKYQRAKELDSSLSENANKRIAQVNSRLPKTEDCFFYGIMDGQSLQVGGWINETVTVKTLK
jgi:tetratricopeptide (TPR) repeat protein